MVAEFQTGTIDELPPEQPKRRGRPPGSKNRFPSERKPGRPRKSLKPQIAGTLTLANLLVIGFQQKMPPPDSDGDALDMAELDALATAIDVQAQQSPVFRKYLEIALGAATGGQLISVLGIIAARRLARHEIMLPKEADAMLGNMISAPAIPVEKEEQEPQSQPLMSMVPEQPVSMDGGFTDIGDFASEPQPLNVQ